jgi:hypothetical protein
MTDRPSSGRLSLPVTVHVGRHTYALGDVSGTTAPELIESLAAMLAAAGDALLGPDATPAPPCEACGAEMVFRRGERGRYVPLVRDALGDVTVFGVHSIGTCAMEAEARAGSDRARTGVLR